MTDWRNRICGHGELPLAEILFNPANWRIHPKAQKEALKGAIAEVGFIRSVTVNRTTGNLIDGHLRVLLADEEGQESIPVEFVELSEAEEAEALATIDPIGMLAVADKGKLDALLRDVQSGEPAVQQMLADLAKDAGLDYGKEPAEAPEAQVDKAAELQAKWQTARGQVWQVGRHRLMCGDSTSGEDVARLVVGERIGAVVFDPPYDAEAVLLGVRYQAQDALVFTDHRHLLDCVDGWGHFRCLFGWDGVTSWYVPGWPLARGKFCLWFGEGKYDQDGAHYGEPGEEHTVTNTRGSYRYRPDPRGKHLATIFQSPLTREFDGHPHAKPVDWLRLLIGNCTGGIVLDLFAGSGAALIAAEQLGRVWLGMELEPATVAVILERAADFGLQPRLTDA